MQEVAFLRQNAEKWKRFEALLNDEEADPDRLATLFIECTDDLAYAQTFYPGSKTTQYLNELTTSVHQKLYQNQREDRARIWTFWLEEVPQAVAASKTQLIASLVIFVLAMGLGLLSASHDTGFVRLILGDTYVNMTLSNIEQGDPLAVYKDERELDMFLGIAFNNVRVALMAFAAGLFLSVGTAYVLFVNGVMIGAFHYLFAQHGLLTPFLLTVYIHGTLEIASIIIAGAAGLTLGSGILFPGAYTRREAFARSAKRGAKIVIGLVPVFVVAAFLEGFVTRYTEMPVAVSLLIIGGSLAFLGWYFVWLPARIGRAQDAYPYRQRGYSPPEAHAS